MNEVMAAKGQVHLVTQPVHVPKVEHVSQLTPLLWIAGGILLGLLVQFAVLQPIARVSRRRGWHGLRTFASAFAAVAVLWGALAGVYIGLDNVVLTVREASLANRTIGALLVLSLTWIAARLAAGAVTSFGRRTEQRMFSASLFASVVQGAIFIVGIITVLGQFGIAIAPLLTTLGLGGLAVAIALRDTLSNLFSGIHIVSSRQIRPGDFIKFDIGIEGEIIDIKWRTTMIRNLQNTIVVVPNEKIAASSFTNYTMSAGDTLLPVTATLAWKGSYERLSAIAARAACQATAEFAGMAELDRCYVDLTAVNETNIQITAYMPLSHVQDRYSAATAFLRRVYDDALAAGMGVSKELP